MRPRYSAMLFDLDGTLLDSADFILGAFEHALRLHDRTPPPRTEMGKLLGPPLADCYRALAPDLDPTPLCTDHRAWQRDRFDLVQPFPHAVETLCALRTVGVRLAAVTARSRVSSLETVDRAGFGDLLEVTVSAEDAARPKPHPDALLAALGHLGVPASSAAMVGDTDVDILAGRAAGAATIGVLYGFHGLQLAACRPDYLLRDIRELLPIVLS